MEGRFESHSLGDTARIARELFAALPNGGHGAVIALFGGLGAGKTHFAGAMARAAGYTGECGSPTYTLVHEYREGGRLLMAHFDMYRISGPDDVETTGYYDYLDQGCLMAIEWSENVEPLLPAGTIAVRMERGGNENSRYINIQQL